MDIKQEPEDDAPCIGEQNGVQGVKNEYTTPNIDISKYLYVQCEYEESESAEQYKVKSEVDCGDDDDEVEEYNPKLTVKTEEEEDEEECSPSKWSSPTKINSTQDGCLKIEVENNLNEIEIQYEPDIKKETEKVQTLPNELNLNDSDRKNDENNTNCEGITDKTISNEVLPGCSQSVNSSVNFEVKELDNSLVNNDSNTYKGKLFKCNLCPYQCKSIGILNKHTYVHSDDKPFKCDMCSYICKRLGRLKQHKLIHSDEKPFHCNICDYKTNQASHLKSHKLIHTDIKPFVCDICQFKCRQLCNLQTHKLVHTSEKLYKCDLCSYDCRLLASLKSHKIIHTTEKSYKCDVCDNEYKRLRNLKIHKTIHSGENMLKCGDCDFSCRLLRNLKSHKKTHKSDKI